MKKSIVFHLASLLFCFNSTFWAQEKLVYTSSTKILEEVKNTKDSDKIIELLNKVNVNDSLYSDIMVSQSYYLLQQKKYDEALKAIDQGLEKNDLESRRSLFLNKGVCLMDQQKYEQAIENINTALKEYPKNNLFYFNRGITYYNMKEFQKAYLDFKKSILLNPYHAKSHYYIANICFQEQKLAQALMAYDMYLILNPDGKGSFEVLQSTNQLFSRKPENKSTGLQLSTDDTVFSTLDQFIGNVIALNKDYKVDHKIDIALTKQNHLLFSQLDTLEEKDGFWSKKYIPFFKWIQQNNKFDDFIYTICYSIENEKFKKIIAKQINPVTQFVADSWGEWEQIVGRNNIETYRGEEKEVHYIYENRKLNAIGVQKDEAFVGIWEIYDDEGKLKGEGTFNDLGEETGLWKWYTQKGTIDSSETYEKGKLNGPYNVYFPNEQLSYTYPYLDEKADGTYISYNKFGKVIEEKTFKDDLLEGKYTSYFHTGKSELNTTATYKEGKLQGEVINYHENGKVYNLSHYKDDLLNGSYELFYANGQHQEKATYKNGMLEGTYESFHFNGTTDEKGAFSNNNYHGNWKLYHADGTLYKDINYNEGNLEGSYKEYDLNGTLFYDFTYKNGLLIACTYFNQDGTIKKSFKKKSKNLEYEGFTPTGMLTAKGNYNIKGGKTGKWEFYSYGALTSKGTYEDGKINGLYQSFYNNGAILNEKNFNNGVIEGYFASYYENGGIEQQGYYENGKAIGPWETYFIDGNLAYENFYHKDKKHGIQKEYAPDGTLYLESKYSFDTLESETYYDSTGKVIEVIDYTVTAPEFKREYHYPNGEIYATFDIVGGVKHGNLIRYNLSGKVIEKGNYLCDKKYGTWTTYFDNGQIKSEGSYIDDQSNGTWKFYFENGNLRETTVYLFGKKNGLNIEYNENGKKVKQTNYKKDTQHGKRFFYDGLGELQLVRFYNEGKMYGYSFNDSSGNLKPMIPIKNGTAIVEAYFTNGKKSAEMEFKNGYFENNYTLYHSNGNLAKQFSNKASEVHGVYKEYAVDGSLLEEHNYNYGYLDGMSKYYYSNGKLRHEKHYLKGQLHGKETSYSESGQLLFEKIFFNNVLEKHKTF